MENPRGLSIHRLLCEQARRGAQALLLGIKLGQFRLQEQDLCGRPERFRPAGIRRWPLLSKRIPEDAPNADRARDRAGRASSNKDR